MRGGDDEGSIFEWGTDRGGYVLEGSFDTYENERGNRIKGGTSKGFRSMRVLSKGVGHSSPEGGHVIRVREESHQGGYLKGG